MMPEPLAVWDYHDAAGWPAGLFRDRVAWADQHFPGVPHIWQVEFWLIDMPSAVIHRYACGIHGYPAVSRSSHGFWVTAPAAVPLGELPPRHLLSRTSP
jgi:hypothetical protein